MKKIRKKLNLTQSEMAMILGIGRELLAKAENGYRLLPDHANRELLKLGKIAEGISALIISDDSKLAAARQQQFNKYAVKLKNRLSNLYYEEEIYKIKLEKMIASYNSVNIKRKLYLHLLKTSSNKEHDSNTISLKLQLRRTESKLLKNSELEQAKLKLKLLSINAERKGIYRYFTPLDEGGKLQIDV